MYKVGVLGAGTWGMAVARVLCNRHHSVMVWSALPQEIEYIQKNRTHPKLPELEIPDDMEFTTDIKEVCNSEYLVVAVPSIFMRSTMETAKDYIKDQILIDLAKGVEKDSLYTMSEIIRDVLGNQAKIVALRDRNGARLWRKAGLNNLTQKVVSLKEEKTSATVRAEILNGKGQKVGMADFVYALDKNGALKVRTTFQPDTAMVKSMARLGLTFRMADAYDQVSYLGRGDHETYIDRNQSGRIGLYDTTVERMFHYYATPQSTANRTDVRCAKLTDQAGEGVFMESNRPFQFSIIPFSDVLLEKAHHINELERDGMITIHLDAEQAGVGTATCGPGVLPQYLVPVKKQSFEFTLYPVK